MINKIIDYFKYNKAGKITLKVDVKKTDIISFRLDALQAQVEWGDKLQSEKGVSTEQFTHQYQKAGSYQILIQGENITGIDMSACCCVNLDIIQCRTLEFINCSKNRLTELDISNCSELYELHCIENQLESITMGHHQYSNLFYISCSSNHLKIINLRSCRNLVNLYCNRNCLKTLDVKKSHKLVVVNIEDNYFSESDLVDFISTLPSRHQGVSGLISISNINQEILYRIRGNLNKKGWFEI